MIPWHALQTEKRIVERDAEAQRSNPKPTILQGEEEDLSQMLASLIASQEYEKFTFRPYAGIVDRRVKLIESSLGHWVVRVSGINEQDALGDATRHAKFIEYFRQYAMNV